MEAHNYGRGTAFANLSDIAGKHVTVMGLGLNGGGLASARFFLERGAFVTVTDSKTEEQLAPSVEELKAAAKTCGGGQKTDASGRLRFVLGTHEIADFEQADAVIKNPGVKFEGNPFLAAAKHIETDLSIFLRFTGAPVIAVTGSKGKSSTASAICYGLQKAGFNAFLGGNITVSPLTFLEQTNERTPVVLELSSWQLADLRGRGILKPKIAVLTTIVPDHQNWYGGMEPYVADKKLIYADQDSDDYTVCKYNDTWGAVFASETAAKVFWYSDSAPIPKNGAGIWTDEKKCAWVRLCEQDEPVFALGSRLAVPGAHMRENVLKAAAVLCLMGVKPSQTAEILASYPGIHHRLEFFHTWETGKKKVLFYNDSAATVPEASAAAVKAFSEPVRLICGGTDKNLDFSPLAACADGAKELWLLAGSGTDKLTPLLRERNSTFYGPFETLELLLRELRLKLETGDKTAETEQTPRREKASRTAESDIVVFSPGATSFGSFKNEFDRGNTFKSLVQKLF